LWTFRRRCRPNAHARTPTDQPSSLEQVATNAPHMLVLAEAVQMLMANEHMVNVLDLKGEAVEAGSLVIHAEKGVMIDIIITGIDPTELADDILLSPA
jgi:hypothetical protein